MKTLPSAYQQFIHKSRYSRWLPEENRREDWHETVTRFTDYAREKWGDQLTPDQLDEIHDAIENLEVMPSMRFMMTAGPAADRSNICIYNCAYSAVDHLDVFHEALYILMNGTGFGFSVEKEDIDKLPPVPESLKLNWFQRKLFRAGRYIRNNWDLDVGEEPFVVPDSKEGWTKALEHVLYTLFYEGKIPDWDLSEIRAAGEPLKVFGGRASGPEPLDKLLNRTVELVVNAAGRQLKPIECHDLMCEIAEIVVVGGVRRAALISLSDLSDAEIRDSKTGAWWEKNPQRALANNSALHDEKPSLGEFWEEWAALVGSGSGERGIINRGAMRKKANSIGRDGDLIKGVNPCAEILLRSQQFCNLSSVVVRPDDDFEDLARKVRIATTIGTLQSSMTDFPILRDEWKKNCEEERLLGVSLNGVFGNTMMYGATEEEKEQLPSVLKSLRAVAWEANVKIANQLDINPSKAITCVKPEGTSSQLNGTSSGLTPWHAKKFIRRIRGDRKDPLGEFMRFYGVENEPERHNPDSVEVFSFPIEAPEDGMTRHDITAVEHLEIYKTYLEHWCDHNPSVTINVKDDEWGHVGQWVWDNFDSVIGVSFLPWDSGSYEQAPLEEVDEPELRELEDRTPQTLPWDTLNAFEVYDTSSGSQELACVAGGCTIESI